MKPKPTFPKASLANSIVSILGEPYQSKDSQIKADRVPSAEDSLNFTSPTKLDTEKRGPMIPLLERLLDLEASAWRLCV